VSSEDRSRNEELARAREEISGLKRPPSGRRTLRRWSLRGWSGRSRVGASRSPRLARRSCRASRTTCALGPEDSDDLMGDFG
jgi:hypothetical protein